MVELIDGEMSRDFVGTVVAIEAIEATEKFPAQYKFEIKPDKEGMKNQYSWVSIPATATPTQVNKKSLLGYLINSLTSMGVTADTVNETILAMKDKKFKWKDTLPKVNGEVITKKEKLLPYALA